MATCVPARVCSGGALCAAEVCSCLPDDQDGTLHLRCTGNHVLDVICVTRAVSVCVVTVWSLILDVTGVDGDTARLLLRSVIDLTITAKVGETLIGHALCDGGSECRLTVIDVSDRTDVQMWLGTNEGGKVTQQRAAKTGSHILRERSSLKGETRTMREGRCKSLSPSLCGVCVGDGRVRSVGVVGWCGTMCCIPQCASSSIASECVCLCTCIAHLRVRKRADIMNRMGGEGW